MVIPRVRTSIPTFLMKTYEMLENEEHIEIVCWSKDGKSFLIKKHNEFRDEVLPNYFKHNNYSSFVRQLTDIKRKNGDSGLQDDLSVQEDSKNQDPGFEDQNEGELSKKETYCFQNEVMNFKTKQKDLEKALSLLITQHESLIKENKILWEEIRKQSEQEEKRNENFFMALAVYLTNSSMNTINHQNLSNQNGPTPDNFNFLMNQRILQFPQRNQNSNQFFSGQMDHLDVQPYEQTSNRDNREDYTQLVHEMSNLSNGGYLQERNGIIYPLPLGKKRQILIDQQKSNSQKLANDFTKVPKSQIHSMIEKYQNGDIKDKQKIDQFLLNLINSQQRQSVSCQNLQSNYRLDFVENEFISSLRQDKPQDISIFDNPNLKRICNNSREEIIPTSQIINEKVECNYQNLNQLKTNPHIYSDFLNNQIKIIPTIMNGSQKYEQNQLNQQKNISSIKKYSTISDGKDYLKTDDCQKTIQNHSNRSIENPSRDTQGSAINQIFVGDDLNHFTQGQANQVRSNFRSQNQFFSNDINGLPNISHSPSYFMSVHAGQFSSISQFNEDDFGSFERKRKNSINIEKIDYFQKNNDPRIN